MILRIKAILGEVNSEQLKKIADVAETYGNGFVHFVVRGCPEIPGIKENDLDKIKKELEEVNLKILDKGIENIQSCFGGYCTEGIMDVHPLLKRIDKLVEQINFDNPKIKISGSGCPNTCGISYLSDIGFFGIVEPKFNSEKCTGCGVCAEICKEKAIKIENQKSVYDESRCKYDGKCIHACPFGAISEGKKGYAVLVGGRDSNVEDTILAENIANFVSEDEALSITEKILKILKENPGYDVRALIEKYGIKKLKDMIKITDINNISENNIDENNIDNKNNIDNSNNPYNKNSKEEKIKQDDIKDKEEHSNEDVNKEEKIDLDELKRGGFVQIKGKNMFSVWVKNLCCNMPSIQLRKIANIAEKYGKGVVLFSSRQIPIIPFINLKDVGNVKDELKDVYLQLAGCGPRVRNIDVCYDKKYCPLAKTNCTSLGLKLDKFFYLNIRHKTKISVSGCEKGCTIPRVLSDIGFVGVNDGKYDVYLGGRLGTHPFVGIKMAEALKEDDCVKFVENYFVLLEKYGKNTLWRSADLISNIGVDKVKEEILNFNK